MDDVICLESELENFYCAIVSNFYTGALKAKGWKAHNMRKELEHIFESPWETIKERMETEGSVWYVWYMDGIRKYISELPK